jgi:hypothetical protein
LNTPKSVRRDQLNVFYEQGVANGTLPEGQYLYGILNPSVATVYGRVITIWPFVEDSAALILRDLLGGAHPEAAQTVFHTLLQQSTRIPVLTALLEDTRINRDKSLLYDELIARYKSLNDERNRYVHWYWITHSESLETYICPTRRAISYAVSQAQAVSSPMLLEFGNRCGQFRRDVGALEFPFELAS